jgi:hypothetical protein
MALTSPDWLAQRRGGLREAADRHSWFVLFGDEPHYRLTPVPVAGKYGCHIVQTNNGRHLDSKGTFPSTEEAVRGGLEDLRKALGW